jgi:uncharacterized membrane protein
MALLQTSFPVLPALAGWLVLLPFALLSLGVARRGFLQHGLQQHLWLAGVVALAFLWQLQADLGARLGLPFGLLGGALFALVFARARAILGLLAALVLHTLIYSGSWLNLGLNGLLLAVLPAYLAHWLQRQVAVRLPNNVFVFILGNGMFVALAVTVVTSLALLATSFAAFVGGPGALAAGDRIAYALLLAWGEALLTGMIFSALVIFAPGVVLTYRQDLYLPPRR